MLQLPIYLDNNATTKVDERVLKEMLPYFSQDYGNASSSEHIFGWKAKEAVDIARERIARLIGAEPGEIIFTSGATESVNLALKGIYEKYASKGNHIITVAIEHKAVLDTCAHLEKMGAEISYLSVDKNGNISLDELKNSISEKTILIAVMYANNETGVIQPIEEIGAIAKRNKVLFFSDATQAVGKIPVDVNEDHIDLMAFSSHKMYGPKGCGALFIRRKNPRVSISPQMDGGGHEKNLRSGTLNVPGIVGFGKAAELCKLYLTSEHRRIQKLRNDFEEKLNSICSVKINGDKNHRLPNTSNITFINLPSSLITYLGKEIAVSSGSACSSANLKPSHVLSEMGLSKEQIKNTIRFSLGRFTTSEEIEYTLSKIKEFWQNFTV